MTDCIPIFPDTFGGKRRCPWVKSRCEAVGEAPRADDEYVENSAVLLPHKGRPEVSRYGFSKSERLLRQADYQRVFKRGRRVQTKHFTIVFCPNDLSITRLGLVVGKRVGNSVARNRVKRRIREFFRLNKSCFPESTDVVLVAKPGASLLNYRGVQQEISGYFGLNVDC